jgi:cbb3-type cytochrome oxidase subunit 1
MDLPGWVLTIGTLAFVLMLVGVEAYTAMNGLPTISDRVRSLGDSASIVVVLTSLVIGYLLAHFWDGLRSKKGKE